MDLREAFVAEHVRKVAGKGLTTYPFMEKFDNGAVAIIDVSGYSTLASFLQDRYGADSGARIQSLLNPHFSGIIDAVHRHAGSVVKFAGDSLVAVWTAPTADKANSKILTVDPDNHPVELHPTEDGMNYPAHTADSFGDIASAFLCCLELLLMVDVLERDVEGGATSPEQQILQGVTMHIGLGCGVTNHVHVGKPGATCEYFVTGTAARQASVMLDVARKNELAISKDCWNAIQREFQTSCPLAATRMLEQLVNPIIRDESVIIRSDIFADNYVRHSLTWLLSLFTGILPSSPSELNLFRGADGRRYEEYINASIVHHLSGDSVRIISESNELRKCAIAFVRLSGDLAAKTSGNDVEGLRIAQDVMEIVTETLDIFNGCLRQFNVDDKGPTLLLVWGVERFAHEKGEAPFALHAALRIKRKLARRFGGGFSIGVSQGVIFSGVIGSLNRSDHTILGVAVNEAARLMCHPLAENGILATEDIYRDCKDQFVFEGESHVIGIKGSLNPKRVHFPIRAIRTRPRKPTQRHSVCEPASPGQLIGRKHEKNIIRETVSDWAQGAGPTLVIHGTTGTGKTVLGDYLIEEAEKVPNSIVCLGRSNETLKYVPFYAVSVMLTTLFAELDLEELAKRAREYRRKTVKQRECVCYSRQATGTPGGLCPHHQTDVNTERLARYRSLDTLGAISSGTELLTAPENQADHVDTRPPPGSRRKSFNSPGGVRNGSALWIPPVWGETDKQAMMERGEDEDDEMLNPQTSLPPGFALRRGSVAPEPEMLTWFGGLGDEKVVCGPECDHSPDKNAADVLCEDKCVHKPMTKNWVIKMMQSLSTKVEKVMQLLGEDPKSLPLLNDLIPVQYHATPFTANLHGNDRKMQITNLIVSVMNKLTLNMEIPLCLVLDDAQWTDSIGCHLIGDISRRCPKVFVAILTRPVTEYTCTVLARAMERVQTGGVQGVDVDNDGHKSGRVPAFVVESGETAVPATVIELGGLNVKQTGKLLLQIVKGKFQAEMIETRLVEEIYRRTSGNPVMIEMLGHSMLDRLDLTVQDNVLRVANCKAIASIGELLPVDAQSAVIAQLDRTSSTMRHVLLVASVAGQYFHLHTLAEMLIRNPVKELTDFGLETKEGRQRLLKFLQANDVFHFLEYTWKAQPDTDSEESERSMKEQCMQISFHHYVVHQSIYGTLVPERRAQLHANYAEYYAGVLQNCDLTEGGERDGVVAACILHLDHCPSHVSPTLQITIAEQAFRMYATRAINSEAFKAYERLARLIETHPDAASEVLDPVQRVSVYRWMCELSSAEVDYPNAWNHFSRALKELGFVLPKAKSIGWIETVARQIYTFYSLQRVESSGGKRSKLALKALGTIFPRYAQEPDLLYRIADECLELFDVTMHVTVHLNDILSFALVLFLMINIAECLRDVAPTKLSVAYGKLGMTLQTIGFPDLAQSYIEKAETLVKRNWSSVSGREKARLLGRIAIMAYARADWAQTEKDVEIVLGILRRDGAEASREAIDMYNVQLGVLSIHGNLTKFLEVAEQYYRVAVDVDVESPHTQRTSMCIAYAYWSLGRPLEDVSRWYELSRAQLLRIEAARRTGATIGFGLDFTLINAGYFLRLLIGRLHLVLWGDGGWENGRDIADNGAKLRNKILTMAEELISIMEKLESGMYYLAAMNWLFVGVLVDWACLITEGLKKGDKTLERDRHLCRKLVNCIIRLVSQSVRSLPQSRFSLHYCRGALRLLSNDPQGAVSAWERHIADIKSNPRATEFQRAVLAARIVRVRHVFELDNTERKPKLNIWRKLKKKVKKTIAQICPLQRRKRKNQACPLADLGEETEDYAASARRTFKSLGNVWERTLLDRYGGAGKD